MKRATTGAVVLGVFVLWLSCFAVSIAASWMFWSWLLMLGTGDAHLDWSYTYTLTHWGLLAGFVMGIVTGNRVIHVD